MSSQINSMQNGNTQTQEAANPANVQQVLIDGRGMDILNAIKEYSKQIDASLKVGNLERANKILERCGMYKCLARLQKHGKTLQFHADTDIVPRKEKISRLSKKIPK